LFALIPDFMQRFLIRDMSSYSSPGMVKLSRMTLPAPFRGGCPAGGGGLSPP
jgi:hypothetical protein